ncbi:hypothetical protein MJM04_27955, partial [Salmonella enterica subsp. enterica serovar Cerro]|nr:hypothetical protein [Salmonella enterica subsp. enterica serovar Cerro]
LKQQTFIESARSIGASDTTILFSHILPGTVSSIVVFFTMRIGMYRNNNGLEATLLNSFKLSLQYILPKLWLTRLAGWGASKRAGWL